jgi:tetratricopeptide (TPR) repeat protein
MNIELDKINNYIYPTDVNKMPLDYYRGVGYYEQKDYNKSIVLFKNAIKMAPGLATIKNNLAAAYYQTGNIESAKIIFSDLKNNYPNYIEPQINMLSVYTNTKNYDSSRIMLHDIEKKVFRKENVKNYSVLLSIKEFLNE